MRQYSQPSSAIYKGFISFSSQPKWLTGQASFNIISISFCLLNVRLCVRQYWGHEDTLLTDAVSQMEYIIIIYIDHGLCSDCVHTCYVLLVLFFNLLFLF